MASERMPAAAPPTGTVLYVHGTGEQRIPELEQRLAAALATEPRLHGWAVEAVPWGELAPAVVYLSPVLPAGTASREAAAQAVLAGVGWRLATDVLERFREPITRAASDFLADAVFYLRDGDGIRALVRERLLAAAERGPVVVAAHSIGGVVALDVLAREPVPPAVRLLVTGGTQAPLLALIGALEPIGPEGRAPFAPWRNLLNPRDPLAFRAAEVFAWAERPPRDHVLHEPRDLPGAHSAYFARPETFALIADALAEG